MTRDEALALVSANCAQAAYPSLSDDQIAHLVDGTLRYNTWEADGDYAYGDVVVPTVPNGHLYRCVVAGTSAATEPFWPTYTAPDNRPGLTRPHWHGYTGSLLISQVGDGTVQWIEAGFDDGQNYDVRLASYRGWRMKAALASEAMSFATQQQSFKRSEIIANCVQMALLYRPTRIA